MIPRIAIANILNAPTGMTANTIWLRKIPSIVQVSTIGISFTNPTEDIIAKVSSMGFINDTKADEILQTEQVDLWGEMDN